MKHLTRLSILSAFALAALVSCQRAPAVPDNPTYDAEKGEVTTQFVLNIAPGTTPKTKLASDVAQVNGNFRGISYAHLLTFELDNDNKADGEFFIFKPGDDKALATRDYDLGDMASAGEISAEQSSRIFEVSLPLKTNALAFYALASKPKQGTMSDTEYNNTYGKVGTEGTGFNSTVEDIRFTLISRLTDENGFRRFGNLMARIMTSMIGTECAKESETFDRSYAYWWPQDETSKNWSTHMIDGDTYTLIPADNSDRVQHEAAGYEYVTGTVTWKSMGDVYALNHNGDPTDNIPQTALAEVLGDAYYQIVTIRKDKTNPDKVELRAGSAASVLKTMRDLNDIVNRTLNAAATSKEDQIAIEMAREIRFRMSQYFTSTDDWTTVNWKQINAVIAAAQKFIPDYATAISGTTFDSAYLPNNTTLSGGFPLNLGLPMSSALFTVEEDSEHNLSFQMSNSVPAYGMNTDPVPITDYRFAPEILYWGNSGIRVNDNTKTKNEYPKTVDTWANGSNSLWNGWTANGSVLSTTRSVAMMKQINYGIALMETNVSYYDLDGTVVYDNNSGIHEDEADNAIVIDGSSFKVTGVFIGGVREKVGWDMIGIIDPVNNKPNKIIYDRLPGGGQTIPMTGSTTFYTTTWDSYVPQLSNAGTYVGPGRQQDQVDVYVALELVNNTGKDIWGELNLIRNGGTFYVVGKLDLAAAVTADETANNVKFPDPKYCHYPPFNADGSTIAVKRVFMQDYMTTANLRFTKNTLKHAYVTVPDLRSSQVSLGLNVDLAWRTGLSFNVDM